MNNQIELNIKTYKNKLTKALKNFLFDTQIFSVKQINIIDVDTNLDEKNMLLEVKESRNSKQIDALVVDLKKFKHIINSFSKKPKDNNIEKLSNMFNKIDKKIIQSISQQFFCIFSYHEYSSLPYEEDEYNEIKFLDERDKFFYYLLINLLDSFSCRRNFKTNDYLYIFSEKEPIEEIIDNHFKSLFYIDKLNLYNYKNQAEYRIAMIVYLRSWSEILDYEYKNKKKMIRKYGDKINTVNFISSNSEIEKVYCFRNFSRTYKRKPTTKYKFSVSSYIDLYASISEKQFLVERIFKYLNKSKQRLNKEEFEIINPRISGNENIYFTKDNELSHRCCNPGVFTLRFSSGYLVL